MLETLDSNKDIETKGIVKAMQRGLPGDDRCKKETYVTLKIADITQRIRTVDFPIATQTEFELIPYILALLGNDVRYKKQTHPDENDIGINFTEWELEFLSGPLKGTKYYHNE